MAGPPRQSGRIVLGSVLIVVLAAAALGIFFLDRVRAFFEGRYHVVALFPEAPGLRAGDPVWVAGVPSGTIRAIDFRPPGDTTARVAVSLELDRSVQGQVREDSRVRLASPRAVGEKAVEILPGSPSSPELADGDSLRVRLPAGIAGVEAEAGRLFLALDSLRVGLAALERRATARMGDYQRVLGNASAAQAQLAELDEEWAEGSLGLLLSGPEPGRSLDALQRSMAIISRELEDSRGRATELGPARESLARHVAELQSGLTRLQTLMRERPGSLTRLRSDTALAHAVNVVQAQMDSLVTETKKKPWRYLF